MEAICLCSLPIVHLAVALEALMTTRLQRFVARPCNEVHMRSTLRFYCKDHWLAREVEVQGGQSPPFTTFG